MTLAIDWPHDPGENGSATRAGGPMTLTISWPHEGGENASRWPHQPGDWHRRSLRRLFPRHTRTPSTTASSTQRRGTSIRFRRSPSTGNKILRHRRTIRTSA
jgi:hypothetical protein